MNIEHPTSKVEYRDQNRAAGYDLEERLLDYSVRIIRLVEALPATRAGNHVAGQLFRSGTSPLPNHAEAPAAESRADFVHKLKVCLKELRESLRWLRLVARLNRPARWSICWRKWRNWFAFFRRASGRRNSGLPTGVQSWTFGVQGSKFCKIGPLRDASEP